MDAQSVSLCTAAGRYWRLSVLAAAAAVAPLVLGSAAWAQGADPNSPALRLINLVPINGTSASPATGVGSTKLISKENSLVVLFAAVPLMGMRLIRRRAGALGSPP